MESRFAQIRMSSAIRALLLVVCLTFAPALIAAVAKVSKITVLPTIITLNGAEDAHGILVNALTSDGEVRDVTRQATFASSQPGITDVSEAGQCVPRGDGRGQIVVSFGGNTARVEVIVTNSAIRTAPSFRQDVLPVLTKAGCNSGACHGKL